MAGMHGSWQLLLAFGMLATSTRLFAAGEPPRCSIQDHITDDVTRQSVRALLGVADTRIAYTRRANRIPGVAVGVVAGRELLWSNGYGLADVETQSEATPETLFRIASISKTFTATAIIKLRDEGKLHLDDPVEKYLPWLSLEGYNAAERPIRLWHLLTHTSGVPSNSASSNFSEWFHPDSEEVRETLPTQRLLFEPGSRYKYSNLGYALLGLVIEAVSGETYSDYIESQIMRPLGMHQSVAHPTPRTRNLAQGYHDPIWLNDDGSMRIWSQANRHRASFRVLNVMTPAGGAASSIVELARYASFHLNCLGDAQVLAPGSIAAMQQVRFRVADRGGVGISWAVEHKPGGAVEAYHSGGLPSQTSFLLLSPKPTIASMAFTNAEDGNPETLARGVHDLLSAAIEGACGPGQLSVSELARYAGRYKWAKEERQVWAVPVKGRLALITPVSADPMSGLTCLSRKRKDEFVFDNGGSAGEEIRFVVSSDGLATLAIGPSSRFRRLGDIPMATIKAPQEGVR